MGNLQGDASSPDTSRAAMVNHIFTAAAWMEGAALDQLETVSRLGGIQDVFGYPDLHPGKYGPVGMTARGDRLHPQLIGADIGCGMSFFALDLSVRKLRIDKAALQLRRLEEMECGDPQERLRDAGLSSDLFHQDLGTIGGGNHFCELQAVDEIIDPGTALIDSQSLYLLVHSGSRTLGASIFHRHLTEHGLQVDGLDPNDAAGREWLIEHDAAVAWASLNRRMIAERAAATLKTEARLIADIPHNLVRRLGGDVVHYKGAAAVSANAIAPVAGSRASLSYIVRATPAAGVVNWGISHGAGRKYDRRAMHGREGANRSEREALKTNPWRGQTICDDRNLLIEEAATAYKDAGKVVKDLQSFGLIEPLAAMKPLITYKRVDHEADREQRGHRIDRSRLRRTGHD